MSPARADRDAWSALAAGARTPNPFFEPEAVLPAVRHLPGGDRVQLAVATGKDGWLAALPILPGARWRGAPIPNRSAWMHPYALLGEPLVAAGPEGAAALRELLGWLRRRTGIVALEGLPGEGLTAATAPVIGRVCAWHDYRRAVMERRPQADDYARTAMSRARLKTLRRLGRQLTERLGEVTVTEEPDAAPLLLELEASGWKGERGTAIQSAGHGRFFSELCAGFGAREDRLVLVVLRAGGRPAAAMMTVTGGDCLSAFRTAYAARLHHYSPGVRIMLEALGAFHARPQLRIFDGSGDPANETLNRLLPDRRAITSLLLAGGGLAGLGGHGAAWALRTVRDRRAP